MELVIIHLFTNLPTINYFISIVKLYLKLHVLVILFKVHKLLSYAGLTVSFALFADFEVMSSRVMT